MIIIGIGIAAFLALRAYRAMAAADPEGTKTRVDAIFQGAEIVRTLAAFTTSFFYVLRGGSFRQTSPLRPPETGTQRLRFGGQLASDTD